MARDARLRGSDEVLGVASGPRFEAQPPVDATPPADRQARATGRALARESPIATSDATAIRITAAP